VIDIHKHVLSAEKKIRPYVRDTPLEHSFYLSAINEGHVSLKLENLQHTGSFKVRGAMNKLLSLTPEERQAGVVTASTGNHGLAVAYGLSQLGIHGSIFLPENPSLQKLDMLRHYGAHIELYGTSCEITESHARAEARKRGQTYISPYNDPQVIAGQGTVAVELLAQWDSVECIMAAVGGGGLISGIAGYVKERRKDIEIIGCLPENSPVMYESIKAGWVVDTPVLPTLSDGTAGGIEHGSITFDVCQHDVDDWVLVGEDEIRDGMKLVFDEHRYVIEGAAGVVVASFLRLREQLRQKHVALVMCGGNVEINRFKELVF
jgi:threonine dehydratase